MKKLFMLLIMYSLSSCHDVCIDCSVIVESNEGGVDLAAQGITGFENNYVEISSSSDRYCDEELEDILDSRGEEVIITSNGNEAIKRTLVDCN